jgi:poly-gamma-glutamate system protein
MHRTSRIVIAGILSVTAFWAVQSLPSSSIPRNADMIVRAGKIMEQALAAVRQERERAGAAFDPQLDPNRTGLIGPQHSPLMTTLGDLAAKRTTTNPNMAGYIVTLLDRAGARPGDAIAIGSSGSFPAFLVAALAAAKAMDMHPVTLLSLGASSFGATDPDFTLLDLYRLLRREGICAVPPAGLSLGGDRDIGSDLDPAVRDRLIRRLRDSGIPLLAEPDLRKNVQERMRIYQKAAGRPISAFINSGGGFANMVTDLHVLDVKPGLHLTLPLPPEAGRGVIFAMAAQQVPVIHLLFVKGLVMEAGLPWDPIPLPKAGIVRPAGAGFDTGFWLIAAAYLVSLGGLALLRG